MGVDYLVKEVKVIGSFKSWDDPAKNSHGYSGGSEFEIAVVPEDGYLWTPQEAQIVAFDVRMKIHTLLMADAQKRGVRLPAEAYTAILKYREEVDKLRNGVGTERVAWKDGEVAPPSMGDLIKGQDDESAGAYLGSASGYVESGRGEPVNRGGSDKVDDGWGYTESDDFPF